MHRFPFNGLMIAVCDDVYEPAEDSFLLAKHAKTCTGKLLEVCTGTGIVSLVNAKENPANSVVAVDITDEAVACAYMNTVANKLTTIEIRKGDMFLSIKKGEMFDWIICNPPYLPANEDEHVKGVLDAALNSGKDGREFLNRFLDSFEKHLAPTGKAMLIHSSYQDLEKTKKTLENKKLKLKILEEEKMGDEMLYCITVGKALE